MEGPAILVQTLTVPVMTRTASPASWQYHSRGGRHSLTACWGVMFDLLANSSLLRQHVEDGKVVFGLDHNMHDYAANRAKNLDLVIARPHDAGWITKRKPRRFSELPDAFDMELTVAQREQDLRAAGPVRMSLRKRTPAWRSRSTSDERSSTTKWMLAGQLGGRACLRLTPAPRSRTCRCSPRRPG